MSKQSHTPIRHKLYDSENIRVTVEELSDRFIATIWDKSYCYEVDREVFEFETYGGAVDKAFDLMAAFCRESELKAAQELAVSRA